MNVLFAALQRPLPDRAEVPWWEEGQALQVTPAPVWPVLQYSPTRPHHRLPGFHTTRRPRRRYEGVSTHCTALAVLGLVEPVQQVAGARAAERLLAGRPHHPGALPCRPGSASSAGGILYIAVCCVQMSVYRGAGAVACPARPHPRPPASPAPTAQGSETATDFRPGLTSLEGRDDVPLTVT